MDFGGTTAVNEGLSDDAEDDAEDDADDDGEELETAVVVPEGAGVEGVCGVADEEGRFWELFFSLLHAVIVGGEVEVLQEGWLVG